MKKIFSVFAVVGAVFCAGIAGAACTSTTCTGKVERAYFSGNTLYVATDGDESALNCTSPAGKYVTIPASDPDFDRKYAMILTAMASNFDIGLRVIDNDPACALQYVFMDAN